MTDSMGNIKNAKDKILGEAKEAIGKVTNNQELELKGKIQSSKSDLSKKAGNVKNDIAGKINDIIDKKEEENKK